jgi:hypothetical protein
MSNITEKRKRGREQGEEGRGRGKRGRENIYFHLPCFFRVWISRKADTIVLRAYE